MQTPVNDKRGGFSWAKNPVCKRERENCERNGGIGSKHIRNGEKKKKNERIRKWQAHEQVNEMA